MADYGISVHVRWETAQRWYEASLVNDLLGDWIVVRRWGGKESNRHGEKTTLVASEEEGHLVIEKIHRERQRRVPVYWRIYF